MMRNLIIKLVLILVMLLSTAGAFAQKVANYAVGKYGTFNYEHFSFWVKNGKRAEINYAYGKDHKELIMTYAGKAVYQGKAGFKLALNGKFVMYAIPTGNKLRMINPVKNNKLFEWAYEGPIDGRGTFCEVCAEDEKDAMGIIKKYFMN
jgi:hypothetical protein